MSTSNEVAAMRLALDVLKDAAEFGSLYERAEKAIKAIEALAQSRSDVKQEQRSVSEQMGEPVAWLHRMDNTEGLKANGTGIVSITQKRKHPFGKAGVDFSKSYPVTSTPLYTTPQPAQKPWVGLTDEEINYLVQSHDDFDGLWEFADAVEAKLRKKNSL